MPYEWYLALEQAEGREHFNAPGNMSRLGFLVDPPHPRYNPDGLPVGFAKASLHWKREFMAAGRAIGLVSDAPLATPVK